MSSAGEKLSGMVSKLSLNIFRRAESGRSSQKPAAGERASLPGAAANTGHNTQHGAEMASLESVGAAQREAPQDQDFVQVTYPNSSPNPSQYTHQHEEDVPLAQTQAEAVAGHDLIGSEQVYPAWQVIKDDILRGVQRIGKEYEDTLKQTLCEFTDSTDMKLQIFQEKLLHEMHKEDKEIIRKMQERVQEAIKQVDQRLVKVTSDLTQLRCKTHVARLEYENMDLKRNLEKKTQECKIAQEKLEEKTAKLKSLTLIKKSEIEGSFTSTDETPAAIVVEYEKLFLQGRRNLVKGTKSDELTGKHLANCMFKQAYEECHRAVLQEMFKELFCHHTLDVDRSSSTVRMQLKAQYGQLLHLKKPFIQANIDTKQLALKVVNHISNDSSATVDNLEEDPKFTFAQNAVEIALKMVTIQPPMIIDYSKTSFDENLHDPQPSQWCDHQDKTNLSYFTPILYSTCEQREPIKKAFVGNKDVR